MPGTTCSCRTLRVTIDKWFKPRCKWTSIICLFSLKYMQAYHCSPYQHPQLNSAFVTYTPCYIYYVQMHVSDIYHMKACQICKICHRKNTRKTAHATVFLYFEEFGDEDKKMEKQRSLEIVFRED